MFWTCHSNRRLLLSVNVCLILVLVKCVPEIPGPHYPHAAGAPGDELINSGTTPDFLSYSATDQDGKEHVYVPVYVAVLTDAGESNFKDVRQNFDKSITLHGDGVFWCAFGHPYRQFAFQDKYKWDIIKQGIKIDNRIPPEPLIRSFLVESHVVKDIMLKATTEPFNTVAGNRDFNVDTRATNQFGIFDDDSKFKLEAFALPGSLITWVENRNKLDGYSPLVKSWGQIKDVADLKRKFNVPTDIFSSPESSIFVSIEKRDVGDKIKLASYEDVADKVDKQREWKHYAEALKEMEDIRHANDPDKLNLIELSTDPIENYPVNDMSDSNTVKNHITKQKINKQHHETMKRLLDSFEVLKEATKSKRLSWDIVVSQFESNIGKDNKLRMLKNMFIKASFSFMTGKLDFNGIKRLKKEMENNNLQWIFSPSIDDFKGNLESVSNYLKRQNLLQNFPGGNDYSKLGLMEYFKNSLTSYISSSKCKLSKDLKNEIIKNVNTGPLTERKLTYTNDAGTGSKILIGDKESVSRILFPGDQLSVEFVGENVDISRVKTDLSKVVDSTLYISSPDKVTLKFSDTELDTSTEGSWKKRAIEIGDYLRDVMRVQNIELIFKESKFLKYDMISHTIDNGKVKEMPVRLANGHLVIDDRIAPMDITNKIGEMYGKIVGDDTSFRKLLSSKTSDIIFVPDTKGLFFSNTHTADLLNSVKLDDYKDKRFIKPIKNEIIVEIVPPDATKTVEDQNQKRVNSAADEASNILYNGYRKKDKNANVVLVSATKENNNWQIDLKNSAGFESYDGVRITIVGVGGMESKYGVWKIGGHESGEINNLINEVKRKYSIKENDLQKVSVVACNPETSSAKSKDNAEFAVILAKDIAKKNRVTVSTRVGFVKVDNEGHKWYSATDDGEYHRRQPGDVYTAIWDGKQGKTVISKAQATNILHDNDVVASSHLGITNAVSKEHESDIFKNGVSLTKEMKQSVESQTMKVKNKPTQEMKFFDNPKVQKRLQKVGNFMSGYGMLQTATFLMNAEKCEKNEYTSEEACEARKNIAIISLTQEATEIANDFARAKVFKMKLPNVGTSTLKSFGKSLLRNPLKGLPLLGVGLDIASLGLDIYDLTKANTPTEKGIAGTSVALSSISLIASGTALAASILGATAIAAVAGPAALIVGLVSFAFSIGVTIWQTEQYEKTHIPLVNDAAKYFERFHSLYSDTWDECKGSTLYIKSGIAVKVVSLKEKYVVSNSEYMCRTHKKELKRHTRVYPLLIGTVSCKDYSQLESDCYCYDNACSGHVNVRSGMDIPSQRELNCNNFESVVLSSAPIVLHNYGYAYFDRYDPVIGLDPKNPQSRFQNWGHRLAREIANNNNDFTYDYRFCYDKYAIINSIGIDKYIQAVTEIELGFDHVHVIVPQFEDTSLVSFSLIGIQGSTYTVHLSKKCKVLLKSNYDKHSSNNIDQAIWKIVVDIELIHLDCNSFPSSKQFICEYESTVINVDNALENQLILLDKHDIHSVFLIQNNIVSKFIGEVNANKFSSDREFSEVMSRYFSNGVYLSMTFTPVINLNIRSCGYKTVRKSYVSRQDNTPKLHYTSEFKYRCSDLFNTDAKIQLIENDIIHYSSALHSLVWQNYFNNNSLISFAILPCHSDLSSNVSYSIVENKIYITQTFVIEHGRKVEAVYCLTHARLYLLFVSSNNFISWDKLEEKCFLGRNQFLGAEEKLLVEKAMISAGENDLTFVNTSNQLYWVRKKEGYVEKRIFPNLPTKCASIEISFPNTTTQLTTKDHCGDKISNGTTPKEEVYYFLCRNGNNQQMFVQLGNNQAKLVENLSKQQIYIDGKDVFVKNNSDVFAFDETIPSNVCLFEYELKLPYSDEESFEDFMVGVSQKYECVESKLKFKFRQLVGWFDFEETTAVVVHESIADYKLQAVGATSDLKKYWIWDTFNKSLYLQKTAESSSMFSLLIGNITEQKYQAMISIPEKVVTDVEEVEYNSGRIYIYTSDGATYFINEDGDREILVTTDHWFTKNPNSKNELLKNTDKEVVMYRPNMQNSQLKSRCKRSSTTERSKPLDPSFIFHIQFGLIYDVDLSSSVFIGSNRINLTIFTYSYQSETLLEIDSEGNVLREESYSIIHRIDDKTLIVESNNATDNQVPPIIDGIQTMILSSSESEFQFHITDALWSKLDEILLSDESAKLTLDLDMFSCDYSIESIEGRGILIDYAYRKKLVIPNAEHRSRSGLIILYVCGVQIELHDTKTYHIAIVISTSTFVILLTVIALIYSRLKRSSLKNNEEFVPNEQELQAINQTTVQTEHVEMAIRKATVLTELKGKGKVKSKTINIKHTILTRGDQV